MLEYDIMMQLFRKLNQGVITDAEIDQLKNYQKQIDKIGEQKISLLIRQIGNEGAENGGPG